MQDDDGSDLHLEPGEVRDVGAEAGRLACKMGWATDLDGVVSTGERESGPVALQPKAVATEITKGKRPVHRNGWVHPDAVVDYYVAKERGEAERSRRNAKRAGQAGHLFQPHHDAAVQAWWRGQQHPTLAGLVRAAERRELDVPTKSRSTLERALKRLGLK